MRHHVHGFLVERPALWEILNRLGNFLFSNGATCPRKSEAKGRTDAKVQGEVWMKRKSSSSNACTRPLYGALPSSSGRRCGVAEDDIGIVRGRVDRRLERDDSAENSPSARVEIVKAIVASDRVTESIAMSFRVGVELRRGFSSKLQRCRGWLGD